MGRTVPSFRITLAQEAAEWRTYRSYLNKEEKKAFDDMFARARNYCSSCMVSVKLVPFYPIAMSILFDHYLELMDIERTIAEWNRPSQNGSEANSFLEQSDCNSLDQFLGQKSNLYKQ